MYRYHRALEVLQTESNLSLEKFIVADNMDLSYILQEFESFYAIKYGGRTPKFIRPSGIALLNTAIDKYSKTQVQPPNNSSKGKGGVKLIPSSALPPIISSSGKKAASSATENTQSLGVVGNSMAPSSSENENLPPPDQPVETIIDEAFSFRPIPLELNVPEYKDLAVMVQRDIIIQNPKVTWSDIAGLGEIKRIVQEAIIYPCKYPEYYNEWLSPWKALVRKSNVQPCIKDMI